MEPTQPMKKKFHLHMDHAPPSRRSRHRQHDDTESVSSFNRSCSNQGGAVLLDCSAHAIAPELGAFFLQRLFCLHLQGMVDCFDGFVENGVLMKWLIVSIWFELIALIF